jgi:hypothetical protein
VSDLTWSAQPALPPPGVSRLYADVNGQLHYILPSGTDRTIIDTGNLAANVATQPLGGDLYGTINNAHIGLRYGDNIGLYDSGGTQRIFVTMSGSDTWIQDVGAGQIRFINQAGTVELGHFDNTGNLNVAQQVTANTFNAQGNVYYFANSSTHYLYYDGSTYRFGSGANNDVYIPTILTVGGPATITGSLTVNSNANIAAGLSAWYVTSNGTGIGSVAGNTSQLFRAQQIAGNNMMFNVYMNNVTGGGNGWNNVELIMAYDVDNPYNGVGGQIVFYNGNIGILATPPANTRLYVSGNSQLSSSGSWATVGTNNNNAWSFYCAGTAGGATGWQTSSSRRFKDNIASIPDALKIVTSDVHGYHYTMHPRNIRNTHGDEEENPLPPFPAYGFIAEEWLGIADDVTTPDDEGPAGALDYGQITAILFEAFKDYMTITDTRLDKLEAA